jgi:hypothetical protein
MKRVIAGIACVLLLSTAGYASARSRDGHSLANYMTKYWAWAFGTGYPDHSGDVTFVEIPPTAVFDPVSKMQFGETDVTLTKHESFFIPIFAFVGERYADGTPDDRPSVVDEDVFTDADVVVTLDGRRVVDGDDLDDLYVDTTYFHRPVAYPGPTPHASAAIWVKGLGFLHGPLSKGRHTLVFHVRSQWLFDYYDMWGWENTWHFTVTK